MATGGPDGEYRPLEFNELFMNFKGGNAPAGVTSSAVPPVDSTMSTLDMFAGDHDWKPMGPGNANDAHNVEREDSMAPAGDMKMSSQALLGGQRYPAQLQERLLALYHRRRQQTHGEGNGGMGREPATEAACSSNGDPEDDAAPDDPNRHLLQLQQAQQLQQLYWWRLLQQQAQQVQQQQVQQQQEGPDRGESNHRHEEQMEQQHLAQQALFRQVQQYQLYRQLQQRSATGSAREAPGQKQTSEGGDGQGNQQHDRQQLQHYFQHQLMHMGSQSSPPAPPSHPAPIVPAPEPAPPQHQQQHQHQPHPHTHPARPIPPSPPQTHHLQPQQLQQLQQPQQSQQSQHMQKPQQPQQPQQPQMSQYSQPQPARPHPQHPQHYTQHHEHQQRSQQQQQQQHKPQLSTGQPHLKPHHHSLQKPDQMTPGLTPADGQPAQVPPHLRVGDDKPSSAINEDGLSREHTTSWGNSLSGCAPASAPDMSSDPNLSSASSAALRAAHPLLAAYMQQLSGTYGGNSMAGSMGSSMGGMASNTCGSDFDTLGSNPWMAQYGQWPGYGFGMGGQHTGTSLTGSLNESATSSTSYTQRTSTSSYGRPSQRGRDSRDGSTDGGSSSVRGSSGGPGGSARSRRSVKRPIEETSPAIKPSDGLAQPSEAAAAATKSQDIGEEEDGGEKKTRFVWSAEIHARFCEAVHALGVDDAKPQAIAALMQSTEPNAEGLPTRQNIKSHLQKYRLLLAKRRDENGGSDVPVHSYGRRAQREAAQAERGAQMDLPRGRRAVRDRQQDIRHNEERGGGNRAAGRSPSDDAVLSIGSGTAEFSAAVDALSDVVDQGMLNDQLSGDPALEAGLQGVFGMNGAFDLADMTASANFDFSQLGASMTNGSRAANFGGACGYHGMDQKRMGARGGGGGVDGRTQAGSMLGPLDNFPGGGPTSGGRMGRPQSVGGSNTSSSTAGFATLGPRGHTSSSHSGADFVQGVTSHGDGIGCPLPDGSEVARNVPQGMPAGRQEAAGDGSCDEAMDYQLHFGSEGDLESRGSVCDFDTMRDREQKGDAEGESWSPEGSSAEAMAPDFFS